jgi:DNA-binding NtrC family response regulator
VAASATAEWAPALAGSLDPAIVVDGDGRILHANRRFVLGAAAHGRTIGRFCYQVCHLADGRCRDEDCPLGAACARMPLRRAVHVHQRGGADRLTRVVARPLTDAPSPTYLVAFRALNHVSALPHRTSLVGRSPAFRRMVEQMDRVAEAPIPLIIVGEPGTGKELVARTLHRMSRNLREPFVVVDCPFPDSALEGPRSDVPLVRFGGLLGWAGHGTLFVDHLLALTPFQQGLLLRLIDATMNRGGKTGRGSGTGPRVIAASETRLDDLPPDAPLRPDLVDTLSIYPVEVPPLRDRVEDIPLLAESVLLRLSVATGRAWRLSPAAASLLQQRAYPGNVRELAYVVERAAFVAAGEVLWPDDFLDCTGRESSS